MKTPTISVVIPCFNNEEFIATALENVRNQSVCANEIVVVDNNCSDKTAQIARDMGAIVVSEAKQGISAARNRGMASCKSEWIALMDVDDHWYPHKLELQIQAMRRFPEAKFITSSYQTVSTTSGELLEQVSLFERLSPFSDNITFTEKFGCCFLPTTEVFDKFLMLPSTTLIHREVFDNTGYFDERMLIEDVEYFARVLDNNKFAFVLQCLVDYRIHGANYSGARNGFAGLTEMTKKMLALPDNYLPGIGEVTRMHLKERIAIEMKKSANNSMLR
ncbi:MAG: glycosyltransferase family 2 protein [Pyrinomonadaceae bacterium]